MSFLPEDGPDVPCEDGGRRPGQPRGEAEKLLEPEVGGGRAGGDQGQGGLDVSLRYDPGAADIRERHRGPETRLRGQPVLDQAQVRELGAGQPQQGWEQALKLALITVFIIF